jgi:hypothetical protein
VPPYCGWFEDGVVVAGVVAGLVVVGAVVVVPVTTVVVLVVGADLHAESVTAKMMSNVRSRPAVFFNMFPS